MMVGRMSEILTGPPKADVVPVKGFDIGVEFESDPKYLAMVEGLDGDVAVLEYAKALVLTNGNAARAAGMVFPDASPSNQRQRGSRLGKRPELQALYNYFVDAQRADDSPVSRDEVKREANKRWRTCPRDNATFLQMTTLVMNLNGIGQAVEGPKGANALDEAMLLADEVMVGS